MSEDKQRAILRKYLLGQLPESKRSRLADRYFDDEELFDELLDVENELLDAYVGGRLTPQDRKDFRAYLTHLPDGLAKLSTAYALKEGRNEFHDRLPATALSRRKYFLTALTNHHPQLQYVAILTIVALLCGLAYFIITQHSLHRQLEQLHVEVEHEKARSAQQVTTAQESEAALKERNLQLERELAQLGEQSNGKQNKGAGIAMLVFPTTLRSGIQPDSLRISNSTKTVLLIMPVSKDGQLSNYSLILQTIDGQLVFTRQGLKPQMSRTGGTVSIRVAAARLKQDKYKLTLQGKTPNDVQDFYFNIIRE
jgi:hypothetical protein